MKVDFHTHSLASPDGSLTIDDYERKLTGGELDCVAITDHNTTEFALLAHKRLGDRIIVGEEVTTREGEIIGLYLKAKVPPHMSALETVRHIRKQGGLVYIPHPFETVRKGVTLETLDSIADEVDIIETHNGRAIFQNFGRQAAAWGEAHGVPGAAGSDAHGRIGWGRTYTVLGSLPDRRQVVRMLDGATCKRAWPGFAAILYPKFNRLRKRAHHD